MCYHNEKLGDYFRFENGNGNREIVIDYLCRLTYITSKNPHILKIKLPITSCKSFNPGYPDSDKIKILFPAKTQRRKGRYFMFHPFSGFN